MAPLELMQDAPWELLAAKFKGDQISITFDLLPVTAALIPARSTAFSSAYGRLKFPLSTGRRAVHSLRSRRMAPLELVQDAPCELPACDFHGNLVMRPPSHCQELLMTVSNSMEVTTRRSEKFFPEISSDELPQKLEQSRQKSSWKRSRRFVLRCLVNVARRICFCQSSVDVE